MPKTTSPSAARAYRGLCKAYTAVAEIFEEGVEKETSARRLIAETAAGQALWQEVYTRPSVVSLVPFEDIISCSPGLQRWPYRPSHRCFPSLLDHKAWKDLCSFAHI